MKSDSIGIRSTAKYSSRRWQMQSSRKGQHENFSFSRSFGLLTDP
ncbi:MAG TPA: hypothetical protein PLX69_24565 [Leptospiraceae bacterium]|nr:hypothetical protein [Leptospiraceae bacterium]HRG77757.1 hypothetical protein [Leptospiraceae bacterium]